MVRLRAGRGLNAGLVTIQRLMLAPLRVTDAGVRAQKMAPSDTSGSTLSSRARPGFSESAARSTPSDSETAKVV